MSLLQFAAAAAAAAAALAPHRTYVLARCRVGSAASGELICYIN